MHVSGSISCFSKANLQQIMSAFQRAFRIASCKNYCASVIINTAVFLPIDLSYRELLFTEAPTNYTDVRFPIGVQVYGNIYSDCFVKNCHECGTSPSHINLGGRLEYKSFASLAPHRSVRNIKDMHIF